MIIKKTVLLIEIKQNPKMNSIKIKKDQSLSGIQLQQYFITILNALKVLAFHQIYVKDSLIKDLCQTQFYHPLTAFKSIDSIKHNKLIGFQLRGFLQREQHGNFRASDTECQEALNSVNKSLLALTYEDFQQLTLPNNVVLRNIAQSRYNNIQVQVGTMSQVYQIKSTSAKKIAQYFIKQIKFNRQFLLHKQNFCSKYGGDVYTLSQTLCKGKNNKINYKQFGQFSRGYKIYFNQTQYKAIYKRSKNGAVKSIAFYENIEGIQLQIQNIANCLLTYYKNIDVKNKMRVMTDQKFDYLTQPSYKTTNIWTRQRQLQDQNKHKQKQKFMEQQRQVDKKDKHDIRYKFYYPHMSTYSNYHRNELKEMHEKWDEDVAKMGGMEIDIRYSFIDKKHYFI